MACARLISNDNTKLTLFILFRQPSTRPLVVFHQLSSRIASSSGPISIRGAALGRVRRNAISLNGDKALPGTRVAVGKPLEIWRAFVQKRWDPRSRFLNLEVCITSLAVTWFFYYSRFG